MFETSFERVLRHDRAVVIGALTVVCAAPMILLYARVGRTATMRVSPFAAAGCLQLDTCWRGADFHLWRRLHSGASSAPCC